MNKQIADLFGDLLNVAHVFALVALLGIAFFVPLNFGPEELGINIKSNLLLAMVAGLIWVLFTGLASSIAAANERLEYLQEKIEGIENHLVEIEVQKLDELGKHLDEIRGDLIHMPSFRDEMMESIVKIKHTIDDVLFELSAHDRLRELKRAEEEASIIRAKFEYGKILGGKE